MARIEKITELRQQPQAQNLSVVLPIKLGPSKSIKSPSKLYSIQASENDFLSLTTMQSKLLDTKAGLDTNNMSWKSDVKPSKSKEKFSPDTNSHKSLKGNYLQKNDVVGAIMNKINKQNFPILNSNSKINLSSDFKYSIEYFIARIVAWRFIWLIEQGILNCFNKI